MKLFPDGDKIFEVISRYDDLLTLEEREDYEPGDTLALIVPFLVLHDISEDNISTLAANASLTGGASDLTYQLEVNGWRIFCISLENLLHQHQLPAVCPSHHPKAGNLHTQCRLYNFPVEPAPFHFA